MIDILEYAKKDVYVIADIHGNFDYFLNDIKKHEIKNCIIIIAGDVGIGFYSKEFYEKKFEDINNTLIFNNIHLIMLRGNHDNPFYFKNKIFNYSNLKTIDDYTLIRVGDETILCVGGAISIDRTDRKELYSKRVSYNLVKLLYDNPNACEEDVLKSILPSYWDDEKPIYDEEKLKHINDLSFNIDYVVTHTSPSFSYKKDKDSIKDWLKKDKSLLQDLNNEREVFDKIYDFLTKNNNIIKKWVYGHFHGYNNEKINGTDFIALLNSDFYFDAHILNRYDE